jgi:hypothetical protein
MHADMITVFGIKKLFFDCACSRPCAINPPKRQIYGICTII